MKTTKNTLIDDHNPVADLENIETRTIHHDDLREKRRQLRDFRRLETAREVVEAFDRDVELFGFTKGQFSLVQLIEACLELTGPASLTISTWTAARTDLTEILALLDSGSLTGTRWLVDFSLQRRSPELANKLRKQFGEDAIRVAKNHAKFAMIINDKWSLVLRTSMNLNHNPRFEDFTLAHDPELAAFLTAILDEVWDKQDRHFAKENPGKIVQHFERDL